MTDEPDSQNETHPFFVKDCALIALATGLKAQNLKELRDQLQRVDSSSLYYHFWGGLLHAGFEEREYGNDFAEWVRHSLHDAVLAERLSVIDPSDFDNLELMRQSLIDIIEERLDESEVLTWVPVDRQYQFIRSQIVVFNTECSARTPERLADIIPKLSASSVFYHFIDARQRLPDGGDDFRAWLSVWGERYADLRGQLTAIDPYFTTLYELRNHVASAFAALAGIEV
jgi:Family of unknown function (DUF5752)